MVGADGGQTKVIEQGGKGVLCSVQLKNGTRTCPLVRHVVAEHQGDRFSLENFTMSKVMAAKDNMSRLLGEGEEIGKAEAGGSKLWNSKGEYGRTKLIRWKQTVEMV